MYIGNVIYLKASELNDCSTNTDFEFTLKNGSKLKHKSSILAAALVLFSGFE